MGTDEELRSLNADSERNVTLQDFIKIMTRREQEVALRDKLMKAFAVFDNDGSGFISVDPQSEFRTLMCTHGVEPFKPEEFDMFMSEYVQEAAKESAVQQHPAKVDGLMDYQEFIKLMLKKGRARLVHGLRASLRVHRPLAY